MNALQRPVRILFIITGLSVGGAETMLLKLLQKLDRHRYDPLVLSLTDLGEMGPRIAAEGIAVRALGLRAGVPNPLQLLSLWRLMRQWRPQIVHTWLYHADLLGGVAARLAGVPAVIWGIRHANLDPAVNKRATLKVVRLCARLSSWLPDRILLNSEVARIAHIKFGYDPRCMQVVPNGFDLTSFRPDASARAWLRESLGLSSSTLIIGMIGRFDVQKNHLGFLDAVQRIHDVLPEVHFLFAGRGVDADNAALVAKAKALGVFANCHLLGLRGDVPRLMAGLDVLVSASIGEAFPNVIGEAMACEVPCVATDVGDSAYVVGDAGYIVPSEKMVELADAVVVLLRLPEVARSALGLRARQRVVNNFNIDRVVDEFDCVYRDVGCARGAKSS